jgi:hypothetical protein
MPLWVWLLANGSAGVVLILLLLDPTRDLRPVFVLLAEDFLRGRGRKNPAGRGTLR